MRGVLDLFLKRYEQGRGYKPTERQFAIVSLKRFVMSSTFRRTGQKNEGELRESSQNRPLESRKLGTRTEDKQILWMKSSPHRTCLTCNKTRRVEGLESGKGDELSHVDR